MADNSEYWEYLLEKVIPLSDMVQHLSDLMQISSTEIVLDWDDWDNHPVYVKTTTATGDFPQYLEINFFDLDYQVKMPDRLSFGRLLSKKLDCKMMCNLPDQESFGYSSHNPTVFVLIDGDKPFQVVIAYDVETDNVDDNVMNGFELKVYHSTFNSLDEAPIPNLRKLMPERPFKYFASVDSTNDIARDWLHDDADSLSVVIADEQRNGRGRRGRTWYTPPDVALAVSVILKPSVEIAPRVSMVGALAVYDLCQHLKIDNVGIKWPNDVQINGKKVSGILPEAVWNDGKLSGVILGMGVNVRNQFKGELVDIATTLENATSRMLNRTELIAYLLERVDYWYGLISKEDVLLAWKSRMTTLGQNVVVSGNNQQIVGQAVDTDPDGALLIKTADGSIQSVLAGDVSLRPQA